MRATRVAIVATGLCLLVAGPSSAAPGGLDGRFGRGGLVRHSLDDFDLGTSLVRTADGRIVVAGGAMSTRQRTGPMATFYVTRYLPNGRVDTSFGSRGIARTAFGWFAMAVDLEQLPDGRLLAMGAAHDGRNGGIALARYTSAGRPDPSFGNRTGRVFVPTLSRSPVPYDVVVADDGKILVAGNTQDAQRSTPFVRRFLADGRPDTSFGANGVVVPAFAGGTDASANALVAMPDGSFVVGGTIARPTLGEVPFLVRYLPNGVQDPTFGSNGMTGLPTTSILAITRGADGRFVAVGSRNEHGVDGGDAVGAVLRFLPTGTLDPTFGDLGVVSVKAGTGAALYSVSVLGDGRIVAAGVGSARTADMLVVRLTALGARDAAFGRNGVSIQGSTSRHEAAHDLVTGPDGAVTTTGVTAATRVFEADTLTARFLP